MYRCDSCHTTTKPGEPMTRVVTETRPRTYPVRKIGEIVIDHGGVGTEIVREERRCPRCADALAA